MSSNKIKQWEQINIKSDYMFYRVLQEKEICKETIEILLGVKIREIKYIEDKKSVTKDYESYGIRLYVLLEEDDKIYDIELRKLDEDSKKRIKYYFNLSDLNINGKICKHIILFMCDFDPFNENHSVYNFKRSCVESKNLELNKGTSYTFFNTKAYKQEKNHNLKALLKFLEENKNEDNHEFINKLENLINKIKLDKIEKNKYIKHELDISNIKEKELNEDFDTNINENFIKCIIQLYKYENTEEEIIIMKLMEIFDLTYAESKNYSDKYYKVLN